MPTILLIGKRGQIGWELCRSLSIIGEVNAYDRIGLDLMQPEEIRRLVREMSPHIIVNAAAYTAVDRAETDRVVAAAVNTEAPAILAEEAQRLGALFVHYSTDYVFDGTIQIPYTEESPTNPLNYYGITKLAAEKAIQQTCERHLILRTSWIYGMRGANFLRTMIRLAEEKDQLEVTNDQVGTPTWSRHVAEATSQMISKHFAANDPMKLTGVFHLTSNGSATRHQFATTIFNFLERKKIPHFRKPQLIDIPSAKYFLPAKRPLYSVLSNLKLMNHFNIQIPHWQTGLELCLVDEEG